MLSKAQGWDYRDRVSGGVWANYTASSAMRWDRSDIYEVMVFGAMLDE